MSSSDSVPADVVKMVLGKTRKAFAKWLQDHRISLSTSRQHGSRIKRDQLSAGLLKEIDARLAKAQPAN